jgi:hypothetical protein
LSPCQRLFNAPNTFYHAIVVHELLILRWRRRCAARQRHAYTRRAASAARILLRREKRRARGVQREARKRRYVDYCCRLMEAP